MQGSRHIIRDGNYYGGKSVMNIFDKLHFKGFRLLHDVDLGRSNPPSRTASSSCCFGDWEYNTEIDESHLRFALTAPFFRGFSHGRTGRRDGPSIAISATKSCFTPHHVRHSKMRSR